MDASTRKSMIKLRSLMRNFNLSPSQKNMFNLELAMLTGGDLLFLPALPTTSPDGSTTCMFIATASHGFISVCAYTSKRFIPSSQKILQLVPITIPELIELSGTHAVDTFQIDPFTRHCTVCYVKDGKMELIPIYGEQLERGIDPFEGKPE